MFNIVFCIFQEGLNPFSFCAFWGAGREFSFTGARGLREIPSTWQPWPRLHYITNKASYDIGMVTLRNDRFGLLKEYEAGTFGLTHMITYIYMIFFVSVCIIYTQNGRLLSRGCYIDYFRH